VFITPATSSLAPGVAVPIPTLPEPVTVRIFAFVDE